MDLDSFNQRMGEAVAAEAEHGLDAALAMCDTLAAADLDEVQRNLLLYLRGQLLVGDPSRHDEARDSMLEALGALRLTWPPFHPDRIEAERIARRAFGPRGVLHPPELQSRWKRIVDAAERNNADDAAAARTLLEPLLDDVDPELRGAAHRGLAVVFARLGDPQAAVVHAHSAADVVADLPPGHWARIDVERAVLKRVLNSATLALSDAELTLREGVAHAIRAINAGEPAALKAWDASHAKILASTNAMAREQASRMDRLVKGLSGPLALLAAVADMERLHAAGETARTLDATEAAYHLAVERGADQTANELAPLLVATGRL